MSKKSATLSRFSLIIVVPSESEPGGLLWNLIPHCCNFSAGSKKGSELYEYSHTFSRKLARYKNCLVPSLAYNFPEVHALADQYSRSEEEVYDESTQVKESCRFTYFMQPALQEVALR